MVVITWLCVFLVFGVTGDTIKGMQFERFQAEPGVYIAELGKAVISTSEWKFVIFCNLSSYWHEWEHLQQTHEHLQAMCTGPPKADNFIRHCQELIQPITYLLSKIKDNNQLFNGNAERKRRAPLDFVGNVLGDLFGVLSQRDAQKYNEQIESLAAGTLKMQSILQQQMHFLDLTSNIIRKEHEIIAKQYKLLQGEIQTMLMHEEYLDAVFQLSAAAFMFKDIQGDLVDILSDVHHGRANMRLLPPSQFAQQLWEVNQQISGNMRVPSAKTHWVHVYKLLETRVAIIKNQIIFEVRIPLVQGDEFQVYNMIPVPTRHKNRFIFIQPQFHYVLVSNARTWYHPISAEDLRACKMWEDGTRICSLQGPMIKITTSEEHCETSLLMHTHTPPEQCQVRAVVPTTFIHQLRNNRWLLVLPKESTFDLLCHQQVRPVTLQGSGIVTLEHGCSLRGPTLLIKARSVVNSSGFSDVVPTFNLSMEVRARELTLNADSLDGDLAKLQQSIAELKKEEPWTQMGTHHVGNYTATSVVLLLIIVLLLWRCYHRKHPKQRRTQTHGNEETRQGRSEVPTSGTKENLV